MAKETGRKLVASNRKARHDYLIEDTFEAGLVLMGTEVKSLRMGRASLIDGYAGFDGDELWLEGVHIPEYVNGTWTNHTPAAPPQAAAAPRRADQDRAQVLARAGTRSCRSQLYFKDGRAKVEIAVAKGKRQYDKRHALRERQDNRGRASGRCAAEGAALGMSRYRGCALRRRVLAGCRAGAGARPASPCGALPGAGRRRLPRRDGPRHAVPRRLHPHTGRLRSTSPRTSPGSSRRGRSGTASSGSSRCAPATRTARTPTASTRSATSRRARPSGAPADVSVTDAADGASVRIRVGSPDQTVTGTQSYVVRYHLAPVVNGFADHAEFYCNLVQPRRTTAPTRTSAPR